MKKILSLIFAAFAFGGLHAEQPRLTEREKLNSPHLKEVVDQLGDIRRLHDADNDGWDDTWVNVYYKGNKNRDIRLDTDGDGTTDYNEMLIGMHPYGYDPIPRKLSNDEQKVVDRNNAIVANNNKEQQAHKWALVKEKRKPYLLFPNRLPDAAKKLEDQAKIEHRRKKFAEIHDPTGMNDKLPIVGNDIQHVISSEAFKIINRPFEGGWYSNPVSGDGVAVAVVEPWKPFTHTDLPNIQFGVASSPHGMLEHIHGTSVSGIVSSLAKDAVTVWMPANDAAFSSTPSNTPVLFNIAEIDTVSDLSNHSYNITSGWLKTYEHYTDPLTGVRDSYPVWISSVDVSPYEPNRCGQYFLNSRAIDDIANSRPAHLLVWASGNDRLKQAPDTYDSGEEFLDISPQNNKRLNPLGTPRPPLPGEYENGYDSLSEYSVSKNTLVVGSINALDQHSEFSGSGPTDDGRMKPDIVTIGENNSVHGDSNDYYFGSGTSFSAPAVAGAVALLMESRIERGKPEMRSETIKALLMHSARDVDITGPDYNTGAGALNVFYADRIIRNDGPWEMNPHIKEVSIKQGQEFKLNITSDSPSEGEYGTTVPSLPIRVTICWHDLPGNIPTNTDIGNIEGLRATVDYNAPTLINDMDVKIVREDTGEEFYPWSLSRLAPNLPATNSGPNTVDNVEILDIPEPVSGVVYKLTVKPNPSKPFILGENVSIIITGNYVNVDEEAEIVKSLPLEQSGLNKYIINWGSIAGVSSRVEKSIDLQTWTVVESDLTAIDYVSSYEVTSTEPKAFFRVATDND